MPTPSPAGLDLALLNSIGCAMSVAPVPTALADTAERELKSILLNGQRLYPFSHRPCLSLRHPRLRLVVKMAADYQAYQQLVAQRQAALQEQKRIALHLMAQQQGSKNGNKQTFSTSSPSTSTATLAAASLPPPPPPIDLLSAVDCTAPSLDGPSPIVDEAYTWLEVGSYYDALLCVMADEGGALYGYQREGEEDGGGDDDDDDGEEDDLSSFGGDDYYGFDDDKNGGGGAYGNAKERRQAAREAVRARAAYVRGLIEEHLIVPCTLSAATGPVETEDFAPASSSANLGGGSSGSKRAAAPPSPTSASSSWLPPPPFYGGAMAVRAAMADGRLRTPIDVCRYRLQCDASVDTVLRKFWAMLCSSRRAPDSSDTDAADVGGGRSDAEKAKDSREKPYRIPNVPADPPGRLPPTAYIVLHARLCAILYHKDALLDLMDFIVGDLLWDAENLPMKRRVAGEYSEDSMRGDDDGSDDDDDDEIVPNNGGGGFAAFHTTGNGNKTFAEYVAMSLGDTVYGGGEGDDVLSKKAKRDGPNKAPADLLTAASLASLPSLTYNQFKLSMLELADNWTASTHPHEWCALLWDWYYKAFSANGIDHLRQQQTFAGARNKHAHVSAKVGSSSRGAAALRRGRGGDAHHVLPKTAGDKSSSSSYREWVNGWQKAKEAKEEGDKEEDSAKKEGEGEGSGAPSTGREEHASDSGPATIVVTSSRGKGGGGNSLYSRLKSGFPSDAHKGVGSEPHADDSNSKAAVPTLTLRLQSSSDAKGEEALRGVAGSPLSSLTVTASPLRTSNNNASPHSPLLFSSPHQKISGKIYYGLDGIAVVPTAAMINTGNSGRQRSPQRNIIVYSVLDWHMQQLRAAAAAEASSSSPSSSPVQHHIGTATIGADLFPPPSTETVNENQMDGSEDGPHRRHQTPQPPPSPLLYSPSPPTEGGRGGNGNMMQAVQQGEGPSSSPPSPSAALGMAPRSSNGIRVRNAMKQRSHHQKQEDKTSGARGTEEDSNGHPNHPQLYTSANLIYRDDTSYYHKDSSAEHQGIAAANAYRCAPIYLFELTTAKPIYTAPPPPLAPAPSAGQSGKKNPDKTMKGDRLASAGGRGEGNEKEGKTDVDRGRPSSSPALLSLPSHPRAAPSLPLHPAFAAQHQHLRHYFRGMLRPLVMGEPFTTQQQRIVYSDE